MQGDPGYVYGDELISIGRRVIWLRALGRGLDDLAGRAHPYAVVRGQVYLVVGAAPQLGQLVAGALVGELDLLPLAELALELEYVAPDGSSAVVSVLPLHVYGVAGCACGV